MDLKDLKLQQAVGCKNMLNLILDLVIYEPVQLDFSEIEIKYDGYLVSITDNIVCFLFTPRIPDIHIIKENNALYHLKTQSVQ